MKKMLLAALAAGALGTAQGAVTNGGFEGNGAVGSFLDGWSTDRSSSKAAGAGLISNYGPCCRITNSPATYPYGVSAAFFGDGNRPGAAIWQDVATTTGTRYTLSFLYGAIADGNSQSMHVTVLDASSSTLLEKTDVKATGTRNLASMMTPHTVDFTATSELTRIRFSDTSTYSNNTDGVLDKLEHGARRVGEFALGRRWGGGAVALESALLAVCQRLQVNIWWQAPVRRLVVTSTGNDFETAERVAGVVVDRGGRTVRVLAGRGVVLAEGGFEADAALRREFLPRPSRPDWTIGLPSRAGADQLEWAGELGLGLAGMGYAWWRPGLWAPGVPVQDAGRSLAVPHGFVVDSTGRRFVNEACAGVDFCRALYARFNDLGPQMSAWLIVDSDHRRRYPLGDVEPGRLPRAAEKSGFVTTASTLPELAWKIKVDASGLQATAGRFERHAADGNDEDFQRGAGTADRARGDRKARPNPCLGAVSKPPFYAVRVVPADLGTKGGLLTDEFSRVLRADGGPMPGLWAIGSAASSVTGPADPAPGVGLAEAMVAGRAAAASIAASAW